MAQSRKASGTMFGVAIGDALGAPVEFMGIKEILSHYPPDGPQEPQGNPARVTDDTQMTLAVGDALAEAVEASGGNLTPNALEGPLRRAFVEWYESPENDRAPGRTCMIACEKLARGLPWERATVASSKGCGANMRVAPVGLLGERQGVTTQMRAAIAQYQAAFTHGHPTALAASDLTAAAVADLAGGGDPAGLPRRLREYALEQSIFYHAEWLGDLWQRPLVATPEDFIQKGWEECLRSLDKLDAALAHPDYYTDPCNATGEGWLAEQAFATGLLCFLLYPEEPLKAVRRAALTAGDSDSIACLTGAFVGAHLGLDAWPADWGERIEYRDHLETLGKLWD